MKKKFFIPAAIVALMGVGAYFEDANSTSTDSLSAIQLANAETLANDDDQKVDLGYDKACLSGGGIFCAISAFQYYWDSTPYNDEEDHDE